LAESLFWLLVRRADRPPGYALHKWSGWILRRLAVVVSVEGFPPARGLIVSNHLSYLDIVVFSSIAPCSFVSKNEVKWWPGIGWVASLAGTIYIDRTQPSATRNIQPKIAAMLTQGACLVLFPEGTSGDGRSVMPFHSSLLQAAVEVRAPITAAGITYESDNGDPRSDVCYWGEMTLLPHALKLFRKSGITAQVRFGSESRLFADRKQAARELWEEVSSLANKVPVVAASSRGEQA
jgi:1-acyl-sn-glycerol-3-phosphate acyltransferase